MNLRNCSYLGGYFLVKPTRNIKLEYISKEFYTVSDCISNIYPDTCHGMILIKKRKKRLLKNLE